MWVKILLLFFVFSFIFKTDHSFDQDLGRHLKIGEIIVQTRSIPLTNLFSFTYPNFPFINSHWLFELLLYLGQQSVGLQAILVLKVIILLLTVWLTLKMIPRNQYLLLPVGFIFLHVLRERPELRPEIFSFLFTALTLFILEKFLILKNKSYKLIFLLPLIQLVWVNTHIYFIVGLILQVIYLTHLSFEKLYLHLGNGKVKLLIVVFLLSVAASLINPNGINGLFYPLNVSKNYGYTIVENQTMFLLESINFRDPNFLFVKIAAAIILLSVIISFVKERWVIKDLGLTGLGLMLALMNVRSFPYLALISLPSVLKNFGEVKLNLGVKILIFVSVLALLYESFLYLNGDYYKYTNSDTSPKLEFAESGKKALDFLLDNNLPTPIYNNFDIGSYIIYRGYPKYLTFTDGRPEAYPKEFFSQIYIPSTADHIKFKELEENFGFQTIIFSITDQTPWGKSFLISIVKDSDWRTVYIDDFMIILVKNRYLASKGDTLKTVDLTKLDPAIYTFDSYLSYLRLSLFLAQTGNMESAQKFAGKGLSLFPQSPLGNALFGINTPNKFFW